MATRDEITAVCDRYIACVAAGDVDGVMALYGEDPRVEDPVGSEPHQGRAAVRAFYEGTTGVKLTTSRIGPVTVAANSAAFQFRIDVDLEGSTITLVSTDVMTFDDAGKIASMIALPDGEADPGDKGA
jgi:steroid delta-isomerase